MMVGTSISNEVDGIRAPTMWPTHLIHHRMAANWSFFDRITLRPTVRCKLIACDTDPRHTFWVGRTSYGESRLRTYTRAFSKIWNSIAADQPETILECGCNVGMALRALANISDADLSAVEPNSKARSVAIASKVTAAGNIVDGCVQDLPFEDQSFDMAFTSGVLIHVAPDDLDAALDELARVSKKYVLMIEYFSKELVELPYRGQTDMLWKADYGRRFLARNPNWKPVDAGFFWGEIENFDDSNWWLLKRVDAEPTKA